MKRVLGLAACSLAFILMGCGSSTSDESPPIEYYEPGPDPGQYYDEQIEEDFSAGDCDPNYDGACVPLVSYDLDCPDIQGPVYVVGVDVHRFDRDRNGVGCEPYP